MLSKPAGKVVVLGTGEGGGAGEESRSGVLTFPSLSNDPTPL